MTSTSTEQPATAPEPRGLTSRTFRSLRVRNFRLFFVGMLVSAGGTWMQQVGELWLVYDLTGSGVALGVTTALHFVPMLFFGAWGGLLADRVDKRRLLIVTQALSAALAVVLGVLSATGVVEVWMVFALSFLTGCVLAVDNPTRRSFVVEMVETHDVVNAISLNSTVMNGSRVYGPAMGGLLVSTVGVTSTFWVNAASYLVMIAALFAMRSSEMHRVPPVVKGKGQLREGLRYAFTDPALRLPLAMVAVVAALAYNFPVVLPLLSKETFGGTARTFGIMYSVLSLGALLGALITAGRLQVTRRFLVMACLIFGVLVLLTSAAPVLGLAFVGMLAVGTAGQAFMTTATTLVQLNTKPSMRGRINAIYSVVFLGSTPIGAPIIGLVASRAGARAAFAVGGVAAVAAAGVATLVIRAASARAASARAAEEPDEDLGDGEAWSDDIVSVPDTEPVA